MVLELFGLAVAVVPIALGVVTIHLLLGTHAIGAKVVVIVSLAIQPFAQLATA